MATEDEQARQVGDALVPWLAIIAWFACGASVGVLVGHALSVGLSVNEFGALGNWVAGLGTLGALVLAYLVHRRDVKARDADLLREEIREFNRSMAEVERANAVDKMQRRNASLVEASIAIGMYSKTESAIHPIHFKLTVINRSSEPAADVVLGTRWRNITKHWLKVSPHDTEEERIRVVEEDIEVPVDQSKARDFIQEKLELRFRMHDRLWAWTPEAGVREHPDSHEVAATAPAQRDSGG